MTLTPPFGIAAAVRSRLQWLLVENLWRTLNTAGGDAASLLLWRLKEARLAAGRHSPCDASGLP